MPNSYLVLKKRQQEEINAFPMRFAFSDEQFFKGMDALGLHPSQTDEVYKFGDTGGFYRRTDAPALREMIDRHEREMWEAINADPTGEGFIYEMFEYELANHEFVITHDYEPTLDALGLTPEDIARNERLQHGLRLAVKAQRSNLDGKEDSREEASNNDGCIIAGIL